MAAWGREMSDHTKTRKKAKQPPPRCEYRRCGGTGRRAVAKPWVARGKVRDGNRTWRVCDACKDLLRREIAIRQRGAANPETGPQQMADVLRVMSLPTKRPAG